MPPPPGTGAQRVARSGWTVTAIVTAGIVLGLVLPRLERGHTLAGTLPFDASGAQATLGAIAAGMITLTGFVFTAITLVVQTVQSMSPRLFTAVHEFGRYVRMFAVFVGTFVYALIVLSRVRADSVPQLSVTLAVVFVVYSSFLFLRLLLTLRSAVTAGGLLRAVADQLREVVADMHPEAADPAPDAPASPSVLRYSGAPGIFQAFNTARLVRVATERDLRVEFTAAVGDFLTVGTRLADVHASGPRPRTLTAPELQRLIRVGPRRTIAQDPAYGIRLLVDIAIRALSPAVNDPTTAVQALDQIDDALTRLASADLGTGSVADAGGTTRIRYQVPSWSAYVSLALDEILHYGAGSLQVVRRTRALLDGLLATCPAARRGPLETRLALLDRLVAEHFTDPGTRRTAMIADAQGLGGQDG
ncbi:DUF2254 domain-containing protein [Catenulispora yoronensis]